MKFDLDEAAGRKGGCGGGGISESGNRRYIRKVDNTSITEGDHRCTVPGLDSCSA